MVLAFSFTVPLTTEHEKKLIRHMHSLSCSGPVEDLYSLSRNLLSVCLLPTDEGNDLP